MWLLALGAVFPGLGLVLQQQLVIARQLRQLAPSCKAYLPHGQIVAFSWHFCIRRRGRQQYMNCFGKIER
jgi:hypothetical protein